MAEATDMITNLLKEIYIAMDINSDGSVDLSEFASCLAANGMFQADKMFKTFDGNKDGNLSLAEWLKGDTAFSNEHLASVA